MSEEPKPTIYELEKILEETEPGQASIAPDGSVHVGPSYEELQSINTELYEALTICKNKLIEYADADEDANLNGSGCFSDPRQFVGSSVDIAEQAINKADGKP